MFKLLDYLRDAADACVAHIAAGEWPLLVLPTGTGKTEVAIEVATAMVFKGHKVLVVVDRRFLAKQVVDRFRKRDYEVDEGCVTMPKHSIAVATAQQVMEQGTLPFTSYDVAIVDEAHELRRGLLNRFRAFGFKGVMGMTATPFRRGLSNYYGPIVSGPTTNDLVRAEQLVRATSVVEPWHGDYRTAFDHLSLLGPALAFVPPRQLQACVSACREAGFSADYVRSGLTPDKIDDVISRFEYGDTQVLVSVAMLSRDYDNPAVRHALDFAKQTSFGLHVQKLSRIMQTAPDKLVARYHDFTGNWQRFRDAREHFWEHGVRDWSDVARYQRVNFVGRLVE